MSLELIKGAVTMDAGTVCTECGGGLNCQHCHPYKLPIDAHRIAELEAALRELSRILEHRDQFIVDRGLWNEYVDETRKLDSLDKATVI